MYDFRQRYLGGLPCAYLGEAPAGHFGGDSASTVLRGEPGAFA
jgi:hypothetical protein